VTSFQSQGFAYEGVVAHVLPPGGASGRPVHRYFNAFNEDWLYTVTPIPDGAYGYGYRGVAWKSP
jgi:hypothetical protein